MNEATRDISRAFAILAALALIAAVFVAFPTSWSAMGQAQQKSSHAQQSGDATIDLSNFDIPEGWGPGNGARIVISDPSVRGA